MNYKIMIFALLTASFGTQWCMENEEKKDAFTLFTEKYAPPQEVIELIKKNESCIHDNFLGNAFFGIVKEIPGIYFKGSQIERIINAERMRTCIKKNNLNDLYIPKKYIYKVNGMWIVFAEMIFAKKITEVELNRLIDLKTVKQLTTFAEETGYADWTHNNVMQDDRGNLVFIDTENQSFSIILHEIEGYPLFSKPQYVSRLFRFLKNVITPEAHAWVKERIQSLIDSNKDQYKKGIFDPNITCRTDFDDPEINFEEVKVQFEKEQKLLKKEKKERIKKDKLDQQRLKLQEEESKRLELQKKELEELEDQKKEDEKQEIKEKQFELSAFGPGFIGLL